MGDWYYIGHYGQLGPLTREQIDELVEGGVIARDTYVWRAGMEGWLPAERVRELADVFRVAQPFAAPPPPPSPGAPFVPPAVQPTVAPAAYPRYDYSPASNPAYYPTSGGLRSDRSRTVAGVLQLFVPGVGRMYLGYSAYGVLQLITAFCGIGWLWSFIDGIVILSGGMPYDGYGRQMND